MRITQGTFSFLPDLSDADIGAQVDYALRQGWACSVEFTDDPHPRNMYWEMWGMPMFDVHDAAGVLREINGCRDAYPNRYIKLNAFDSTRGFETMRLSFIVNRPHDEPGFHLERGESAGRRQHYSIRGYATDAAPGRRYAGDSEHGGAKHGGSERSESERSASEHSVAHQGGAGRRDARA
jgi:ribulose-bisphosphate carboxylase small chain